MFGVVDAGFIEVFTGLVSPRVAGCRRVFPLVFPLKEVEYGFRWAELEVPANRPLPQSAPTAAAIRLGESAQTAAWPMMSEMAVFSIFRSIGNCGLQNAKTFVNKGVGHSKRREYANCVRCRPT